MLAWSAILGTFKFMFNSELSYGIHIVVSMILVSISIAIIILQIKKTALVGIFQALWWFPQLVILVFTKYKVDRAKGIDHSLYHWPIGYQISPHLGWEINPDEFFFLRFNLIALAGIIIALFNRKLLIAQQIS